MREILTSKNQFNYSIKQIVIDYDKMTYSVYYGGECRIAKANSSTKNINNKISQLQEAGFICESNCVSEV